MALQIPKTNFGKPKSNVKCVPTDENWPEHKPMHTVDFGEFYPGEVKTVDADSKLDKLLRSGEFEVTDDEPNSEEIYANLSDVKAAAESKK